MERVIQVLNRMQSEGVVKNYAIGGGIAAIYYIEPYETDDLDIFIPVSGVKLGDAGLISLEPIYSYLSKLGYQAVKEGVVIEDWLVQFIPTFHKLQDEALDAALTVTYGATQTRIFSPEYLAAELLRSGRLKDQTRVIALIAAEKLDMQAFNEIIERHGLTEKWAILVKRFDLET